MHLLLFLLMIAPWGKLQSAADVPPPAPFRAGVARVKITPGGPIWMSGYANRTKPSEGVLTELWAKALAIQDGKGYKIVLVTTDLIGLPRSITDEVAARAEKQYGLRRAQVLFNSSHTHTGPVVWPNLSTMFDLGDDERTRLAAYSSSLRENLFTVIGAALGDLAPARIAFGQGETGFAINRRQFSRTSVQIGVNPKGPMDHSVPVFDIRGADGKLKAVLFGYACHNTTLTGEHHKISGDYAGYAQMEIESAHPGATALFLMLCGADQNPNPRSKEELAIEHGKSLAAAVESVLKGKLDPLRSPVKAAYQSIDLAFAIHTRETFETDAKDPNVFKARRARQMLAAYDAGRPVRSTPYPVQAIRFSKDLTVLALGGEVVVDYVLRTRRDYPKERLVVAGYSNDVMCYIPSLRVLREGGYEADTSMIYYGQPGKFAEDVEDRIFRSISDVLKRVGVRP